ncbi:hypothetical protein QFC22_002808 [Naganishia vaughanmartiniae]|uniref:Uncharacterized protein n=1 Tax=Naganishia vaughanmartiniae TaxID=1424756 RepID=A0ACC2XB69_9TREE|nr:hypothetical protein QFC22_002808 [Naganishia vaughanmartiniae]
MPNLTDLPAEIIDNIADFILDRERSQYAGLDKKVVEPICDVSVEGGSVSLCYFISRCSDLKSLASVSRYLRIVLFEMRFVHKIVVRDTYAWRQDQHAQTLRDRIDAGSKIQRTSGNLEETSWSRQARAVMVQSIRGRS